MPTVLLGEADRDLRDAYLCVLSRHGLQVDTANDGLECVAKLQRFVPNLLILDLDLPWGGGDGVLDLLREEPQLMPNQVILTSAVASRHVLDRLTSPPVVRAFAKPFPLSALLECVAYTSNRPKHPSSATERRGVLVVDDEPGIRDVLRKYLQHAGFHVWTASCGEEALDHCCDHGEEIAVVLLDIQMPGLDGPQTLGGIRSYDINIPVCFMTGDPGAYEPSDLLGQGARYLFTKPFRMDEVVRTVRDLANEPLRQLQEN